MTRTIFSESANMIIYTFSPSFGNLACTMTWELLIADSQQIFNQPMQWVIANSSNKKGDSLDNESLLYKRCSFTIYQSTLKKEIYLHSY